ncbi:flagellar transcriptional regulator FlhC [Uliginosibacterium aquaticum]|uniref:Flagellar transcriptional regulator FlhC n=1 Tax=Uliginosibacterium aquaticum TaxID=2731212 RepID=A0ABX2IF53_9RHOO|nr:flagellar transcriptional regulator FlhC [Uliginosibacterium aquaticum]NSL55354.1 flagellar transcriptional regulator FlhC [Uliginosibacterium aquaticum]
MRMKSLVQDAQETQLAIEMIELGARMQMLESETGLSRERLLKLYKEIRGESPPKGMLPFSTDWFIPWQQNVHASLYMSLRGFVTQNTGLQGLAATLQAFRMYREQVETNDLEQVLSLTRAWTLVRFFEAKMLQQSRCTKCGGSFVAHAFDPTHDYVCGLCHVPARAGKGKRPMRDTRSAVA